MQNIQELQQTIEDLEALQQVSEELEHNQSEVEKQLRTSLCTFFILQIVKRRLILNLK